MLNQVSACCFGLLPVFKRHHHKILVVPFIISVQRDVSMAGVYGSARMRQTELPQVLDQSRDGAGKIPNGNPWFQVEASRHMKHS